MATSLELDDGSSEEWALDNGDGDAAYVDRPTVRSQLFYATKKNP